MSQTPIYDELIATLAKPNADASQEKPPAAARAKSATRTPARPPRTPAGESAADNSTAARKNRRHRAEP